MTEMHFSSVHFEYAVEIPDRGFVIPGRPGVTVSHDIGQAVCGLDDVKHLAARARGALAGIGCEDIAATVRILTRKVETHHGNWIEATV